MIKRLLSSMISSMERTWNYDASYMRDLLDAGAWTFVRFGMVASLGRGRHAPREAMAAAGITGTLAADCGPCTQIGIDMAAKAGVPAAVLMAILSGDEAAMGETAAIGWRFARAVLARDMEAADPARDEIVRRWGKKALVDIALALTTSRLYPTVKYALGHGKACSRVLVAGEPAPFHRPRELVAA